MLINNTLIIQMTSNSILKTYIIRNSPISNKSTTKLYEKNLFLIKKTINNLIVIVIINPKEELNYLINLFKNDTSFHSSEIIYIFLKK